LKEANLAYETVRSFFSATGKKQAVGGEQRGKNGFSKTELAAELGTGAVLTLWSYLSDKINHILSDDVKKNGEKPSGP